MTTKVDLTPYLRVLENATQNFTDNFLVIGEVLNKIVNQKLYGQLENVNTIDQFLNYIGIKRANAYHAMRVSREFGFATLEGIPHDRLVRLLALRLSDEHKPEWIAAARNMAAADFNDKIRAARGLPAKSKCQHTETVTKVLCKCCGKVLSVA